MFHGIGKNMQYMYFPNIFRKNANTHCCRLLLLCWYTHTHTQASSNKRVTDHSVCVWRG